MALQQFIRMDWLAGFPPPQTMWTSVARLAQIYPYGVDGRVAPATDHEDKFQRKMGETALTQQAGQGVPSPPFIPQKVGETT